MKQIGFSTGCLFHKNFDVKKSVSLYAGLGLDNIELAFLDKMELEEFKLDKSLTGILSSFKYISIHAPCIKTIYRKDRSSVSILDRIKYMTGEIKVNSVVFHPDIIEDFDILGKYPFCKSFENMDKRKKKGFSYDEINSFRSMDDIKFVFDIQHAYEHDGLCGYSEKVLGLMKDRLSHLHLSGSNEQSSHSLLHCSANKEKIIKFLNKYNLLEIPVIFEGGISNIELDISNELEFFKNL